MNHYAVVPVNMLREHVNSDCIRSTPITTNGGNIAGGISVPAEVMNKVAEPTNNNPVPPEEEEVEEVVFQSSWRTI